MRSSLIVIFFFFSEKNITVIEKILCSAIVQLHNNRAQLLQYTAKRRYDCDTSENQLVLKCIVPLKTLILVQSECQVTVICGNKIHYSTSQVFVVVVPWSLKKTHKYTLTSRIVQGVAKKSGRLC